MQPILSTEIKNFQTNAPPAPDLKSNIDIKRVTERKPSTPGTQVSLNKRKATCLKQLQVLDSPELYIKIKKSKRNPVVFPFVLGGSKHFKIDPDIPLLNHNCSLRIPEDNQQQPNAWNEAVTRLSNLEHSMFYIGSSSHKSRSGK